MKKLYIFLAVMISFLIPLNAMAAVDVIIDDNSTDQNYSISISVDTGIDTLEKMVLPIEFSDNVVLTEIVTGSVICNRFDSSENNSVLTITCELDSPATISGILANIDFTSTTDDYSFTILENSPDLDIGELELGMVTNIEGSEFTTMTDDDFTIDDDFEVSLEDDFFVTGEDQELEQETTTTQGITEYLPYILIGGSVILLISIVGILLSKKDSPKKPEYSPVDENSTSPTQTTPQNESTLRDMVNSDIAEPTTVAQETTQNTTPAPVQPQVNTTSTQTPPMPTNIPAQQDNYQNTTPAPQSQTPPPVSSSTEEQDLQDILRSESPSGGVASITETPNTEAQFSQGSTQQTSSPQPTMEAQTIQESQASSTPEDELRNNVAKELEQVAANPQSINEGNGINLGQQTPQVPPVQNSNNQGDMEEDSMPATPPTM